MSFDIFKKSMTLYMENQNGINSYEDFAKKLTMEYDVCIRMGHQTINLVSIEKGNTELMISLVTLACATALEKQEGLHGIINDIGIGIIGYWTGATLNKFPPPIIPAIGSFQNISSTAALVTNPGKFPDMNKQSPTTNVGVFLDTLITAMTIHLTTIEGMYMTMSMYPGVPVTIAPGILKWTGYTVTPASPTIVVNDATPTDVKSEKSVETLLKEIPADNYTVEGVTAIVKQTGRGIINDSVVDTDPITSLLEKVFPNDTRPKDIEEEVDVDDNTQDAIPIVCGADIEYETYISPNFKLRHLTLDPSWPHLLRDQVGLSKDDIICNLQSLAINIIEPLALKYPGFIINSGFRAKASLPGKRVSQHQMGEAIDIQWPGLSPREYLPRAKWMAENLSYDQIIFEHGNSIWLHVSNKRDGVNRKNALTMYNQSYEPGIKCYYS